MRIYRKYNKFPHGPNGVPIFGIIFYARWLGFEKYHADILPTYGPIVSYPTMTQHVVLINDPQIARKIYSNQDTLNRYEPFLHNVSNAITYLNGPKWSIRRKNVHSNLIATINSEQVVCGSVTFIKNVLFPYFDKNPIINDMRQLLRPLTFNLVLYACCGKHIKSLNDPFYVEFDRLTTLFWGNLRKRMFTGFLIGNGRLYNMIFKNMFNLSKLGESIRQDKIKLIIEYDKANSYKSDDINININKNKRKCFMDYVRETKSLNNEELYNDIASLLLPSIDTTSNTLGFCLLLLCKYPNKIQEFIYSKELYPIFNGNVDNINLSQNILSKLPYFRAFIFETMRIYPTTPVTAVHYLDNHNKNKKQEPIKVEISSNEIYEINKNAVFAINTIGIGRNPIHWVKNQNQNNIKNINMKEIHFEFWIDDNGLFKTNKSFTIFSLGRRQCVGKQVAIKNLYVVLASLMLRYKFSVNDHENWEIPCNDTALFAPGKAQINVVRR